MVVLKDSFYLYTVYICIIQLTYEMTVQLQMEAQSSVQFIDF